MNDTHALETDREKARDCFYKVLGILQKDQVDAPDAVSALLNILVLVWAKDIGGSREDLLGNVELYFDRAESLLAGNGGMTQ